MKRIDPFPKDEAVLAAAFRPDSSRRDPNAKSSCWLAGCLAIGLLSACSPNAADQEWKNLVGQTQVHFGDGTIQLNLQDLASASIPDPGADEDDTDEPDRPASNRRVLGDTAEASVRRDSAPATGTPRPPQASRQDLITAVLRSRDISVGVTSLVQGGQAQGIQHQNVASVYIPASTTKIVSTAIALKELGADFRFKTELLWVANEGVADRLTVIADGDPSPGRRGRLVADQRRFEKMAKAMAEAGVKEIRGSITLVASDERLREPTFAEGVAEEDLKECYGSMPGAFNFRTNCAIGRIHAQRGLQWESSSIDFPVEIETSSGQRNALGLEALLNPARGLEKYRVRGTYNAQAPSQVSLRLPIGDASGWYGEQLVTAFRSENIRVRGEQVISRPNSQQRAEALSLAQNRSVQRFTVSSADLAEIVEAINKPSDNFLAEIVYLRTAVNSVASDEHLREGAEKLTRSHVREWMRRDGHEAWSDELRFIDGSGLSTFNRATPRAFLALLRQLTREPTFSALWESLPIAGEEGTLEGRMRRTLAEGRVRAKTGTLSGSYQLVGYVPRVRSGQPTEYVPFVILTSTTPRHRSRVRAFQDAIVARLAEIVQNQR